MTKKQHYPEANSNPDFPKIEENILSFWKKEGIFEKSISQRPTTKDNKNNEFVFYDGPPFANGLPHYGHLLTGFVKDIFARYQTMKGKRVERRFGWDCHGLPAEMGAEKELGISGRFEIEKFGIDKFNDACRTSVMKYTSEWEQYVTRQARWVDFKNDYKTMDKGYMESVLWAFKQLWDKGLVYESMRVMPYSWACETPLSNFETRMDNSYRERTDKAITVAFELEDGRKILAWTTTPWTLPSNLALAVKPDFEYSIIEKGGNEYIIAKNAANSYASLLGVQNEDGKTYNLNTTSTVKGSELIGLKYEPLFPYFANQPNAFKIIAGDFIEEGSGTGVVHIAPGFGEDDQRVAAENGIDVVCPVDNAGRFTAEIYDLAAHPLRGGGNLQGTQQIPGGVKNQPLSSKGYSKDTLEFSKTLRKELTPEEKKLWYCINNGQLGFKFRKQQPIGKFVVDFYCSEAGIIVELDGSQHVENKIYDDDRTKFLEFAGYKVLRFWNNDVTKNLEGVVTSIKNICEERSKYLKDIYPPRDSLHPADSQIPAPPQGGGLSLRGLNVIADKNKNESEPYNPEQLEKNGLVNLRIIDWLKNSGKLIKAEDYKHNYPHCWRTDTPLIYKAVPSWYVEVTKFKDRMVELNNQNINWIPSHIRDGQFGKWLENARDWSISRNRYWGSPIPVWKSDNPKSKNPVLAFGSIAELEAFFVTKVEDLHRPFIDQLTKADDDEQPENPRYFYKRVGDVFDCWFESGSMPYAQVHYPFENKEWFETHFPADFIVEYVAQTRGWFYTLMVLSTALFDRPPFLNCICHGVVLDDKGQKLSKRLNNYADPMEIFNKYGADSMRWVMISAPIMHGGELLIDKEGNMVRDAVRLVLKPVWNAYNFFTLYANADGIVAKEIEDFRLKVEDLGNTENLKSTINNQQSSIHLMDRYILAKCRYSVENISKALDSYDTPSACREVEGFFEILNNWYIRRSKERFWKSEKDEDKQAAYDTLYTVLHIMCRAFAPLLPLVTEEVFLGLTSGEAHPLRGGGNLQGTQQIPGGVRNQPLSSKGYSKDLNSVHLQDFPDISKIPEEEQLIRDMDKVRDICNAALAIRSTENIRVRQPLSSLTVVTSGIGSIANYKNIIEDEINVKDVVFVDNVTEFADYKLKINFPVLGKRLPAKVKDIIAASKQNQWTQLANGKIEIAGEALLSEECSLLLEPKDKKGTQALSSNDALVLLDLNLTKELKIEGVARDLVRLIQQSRKEADLNITDRITINVETDHNEIKEAVASFNNYIAEQTLAVSVASGEATSFNHRFEQKLDGENVVIGFKKVA